MALFFLSLAGDMKVYSERLNDIPLMEYKTENRVSVKYVGFATIKGHPIKFFYDCQGARADGFRDIRTDCHYLEASNQDYTGSFKISDIAGIRTDGYVIDFPFYVQAARDIRILLTKGPIANRDDYEYDFGNYIKHINKKKLR